MRLDSPVDNPAKCRGVVEKQAYQSEDACLYFKDVRYRVGRTAAIVFARVEVRLTFGLTAMPLTVVGGMVWLYNLGSRILERDR